MIQNFGSLKTTVLHYNNILKEKGELRRIQIQKIYSTPHLICLSIRHPGNTQFIYLGRGSNYEGVWIGEGPPRKEFRIRDRFLEYLRKHLMGGGVKSVFVDTKDRILIITYTRKEGDNFIGFFWKGRKLYFQHFFINEKGEREHFSPWKVPRPFPFDFEKDTGINYLLKNFDQIGRMEENSDDLEEKKENTEFLSRYSQEMDSKLKVEKRPKRKDKYFKKKIKNIGNDLGKSMKWKDLNEKMEGSEYLLPEGNRVVIDGFKFKFESNWNEYKKRDQIYLKIKSLKKAEKLLNNRLAECQKDYENFKGHGLNKNINEVKVLSPVWDQVKSHKKKEIEIHNLDGDCDFFRLKGIIRMAIGKSSHSNDNLRKNWAKKEDFWFHLEGFKSGHVFVKNATLSDLDLESCELIGSLLRDYAHIEGTDIPMVFTQVKNLKGVKGSAGMVLYKKEKHIIVKYNSNWPEIISKD
jgi:predicted ribosome quality control (RQC) complex YloA/Tae2 family protein